MSPKKIRTGIIGCGTISRIHIRNMFNDKNTEVVALCDSFQKSNELLAKEFTVAIKAIPPNETDIQKFLTSFDLDAVLIAPPHAMHHDHTVAALEAGLDVLLEKPMDVNTEEALSLIKTRDQTGKTLVTFFQGNLSPLVRLASQGICQRHSMPGLGSHCHWHLAPGP